MILFDLLPQHAWLVINFIDLYPIPKVPGIIIYFYTRVTVVFWGNKNQNHRNNLPLIGKAVV